MSSLGPVWVKTLERWIFGPPSEAQVRRLIRSTKFELDHLVKKYQRLKQPHVAAIYIKKLAKVNEMEQVLDEARANEREVDLRTTFFDFLQDVSDGLKQHLADDTLLNSELTLSTYHATRSHIEETNTIQDEDLERERLIEALPEVPTRRVRVVEEEERYTSL